MYDEPTFDPPPSWELLTLPRNFGVGRSFVSGETDGDRLRIYYYMDQDKALCALAWWGRGAEGPPGHAHGGSMAAVLDEGMGFAAWFAGNPVVAASITVDFEKRLPLGVVLEVRTQVQETTESKVNTTGRIQSRDGSEVYARATGLFVKRPIEEFGTLADGFNQQ
jgi:hypothetical protein